MNKYLVGFIAGFIATAVLSLLILLKAQIGLMPELNPIRDFNQFFGAETPILGWILHILLGTFVWGGLFALIASSLTGVFWLRGIIFGIIVWLLMMIGFMPVMDHGFFAIALGVHIMITTLVLHIIYGFVLGLVYGWLPRKIEIKKY